jgi:hypothetical protein
MLKMAIFCKIFSIAYINIVHCAAGIALDERTFAIQLSFFVVHHPIQLEQATVSRRKQYKDRYRSLKEKSVEE